MELTAAPLSPVAGSPPRARGSVRRTSHLDVALHGPGLARAGPDAGFLDVAGDVELHVEAAARDLATQADGRAEIVDQQALSLVTDERRRIVRATATPTRDDAGALVGRTIGAGFRTAIADLLASNRGTPYALLLFDLPTIGLISGFAVMQRLREADAHPARITPPELLPHVTDVCAGWAEGSGLVESIAAGRGVPFRVVAPAPAMESEDDGDGWHPIAALPIGSMRRRRRIDVQRRAGQLQVDATFRDTYGDPELGEIVLHEYALAARFEASGERRLLEVQATPHVLPQPECPAAVSNVRDLVGTPVADLRTATRSVLGGPRGCTHLNDLINALAELPEPPAVVA